MIKLSGKRFILIQSFFLITPLLLNACQSTGIDQRIEMIGDVRYTYNLKVTNLNINQTGSGILARADITNNNQRRTAAVYYQCIFIDKYGNELSQDNFLAPWRPVLIYANQTKQVQCSTANLNAVSFKIQISSTGNASNVNP